MVRWLLVVALIVGLLGPAESFLSVEDSLLHAEHEHDVPDGLFEDYHHELHDESELDQTAVDKAMAGAFLEEGAPSQPSTKRKKSKGPLGQRKFKDDLPAPLQGYRTGKRCSEMPAKVVRDRLLNTNYVQICVRWSAYNSANPCKVAVTVKRPKVSKKYRQILRSGKVRTKVCGTATYRNKSDCRYRSKKASCLQVRKLKNAYNARLQNEIDRVVHCWLKTKNAKKCSDPVVDSKSKSGGKKSNKKSVKDVHRKKKKKSATKKKPAWWRWGADTRRVKDDALWMAGPLLDTPQATSSKNKVQTHGSKASQKGSVRVVHKGQVMRFKCKKAEATFLIYEKKYLKREKLCTGSAAKKGACIERLKGSLKEARQAVRRCHKKFYH